MTTTMDHLIRLIALSSLILSLTFCRADDDAIPQDNSTSHVYTFAKPNSFMQLETHDFWNIANPREVNFIFRTNRPHGLLMYHTLVNPPVGFPIYELYVLLENGRLKVVHEFGEEQQSFYLGQGLNHDKFHQVNIFVDPVTGKLTGSLDKFQEKAITLKSLANYFNNKSKDLNQISFVMYFGGINQRELITHQQYGITPFIGCLGKIKFLKNRKPFLTHLDVQLEMEYVKFINHRDLSAKCINRCSELDVCSYGSRCVNHYTHSTCDCFGTGREDWTCRSLNVTAVTLRGYSYVSYKIYNYKDRVHSDANRIGLHFKTWVSEAVLLYANGEHPNHNHVAVSLYQGTLFFEIDLGDGPLTASFDLNLSDGNWHNFTIMHHASRINLTIDETNLKIIELKGHRHHLHVDPDIFFGGLPSSRLNEKLTKLGIPFDISWKFVGCLKSVYFNEVNVLYELHKKNRNAEYHSLFSPEFGCVDVDPVPITFSDEKSHFISKVQNNRLKLSLEFKTEQEDSVIASGNITNKNENQIQFWILRLKNGFATLTIYDVVDSDPAIRESWTTSNRVFYKKGEWQHIQMEISESGSVLIVSNYKTSRIDSFKSNVSLFKDISFGFSINETHKIIGFRGCVRNIFVNDQQLDPRFVVSEKALIKGKISLDNCQLVNPCDNPNVCEHNGQCESDLESGEIKCNCEGTGYRGKTCHFSLFKRSCEELFLAGYRQSGTYMIDVDRNGPLPPARVICLMSQEDGVIQTIIEHNMRRQMVVRERAREGNFYLNITYRDFTPEMLNYLITNSKQCSQYIKYECNQSPLSLTSYTLLESAYPEHRVASIGSVIPGRCKCSTAKNCYDNTKYCNCDSEADVWIHDDGFLTNPKDVGITKMYFIQPKNWSKEAEAHMILGNVSCIDSNTREYEITFKTKESYLEVPGWENGEMAISFKTTASKAVLFYQAPLHSLHGYIKAVLTGESEVSFEFLVNRNPRLVIVKSSQKLNTGDWQQVWVERDVHHMRFTVNQNSEFISLDEDDEIVAFEGPLYVGGAPRLLLADSDVRTGFIGCLRGLVINDKVINLSKHLHRKLPNIETGCKPSCQPHLCKNNATCIELWGSYECRCANPIAHLGKNCEINYNLNGMTFITPSSYFMQLNDGTTINPILEKNILISFRTHMNNALIFYANDYRNNFVQLHIENGTHVIFTFNSLDQIVRGAVDLKNILTSGATIQVKIDRIQRTKTILTVNSFAVIIDHPIKFLTKYSQKPWAEGEEFELVKPARPPVPIEAHSQFFIGGVDEIGASSKIQGIVGCLQGFVINGVPFDLEAVAKLPNIVATGQIKPGCTMLCDKRSCANGGVCFEQWKNKKTSCDCKMTSYQGENCKKDVGARFNGQSIVQYTYNLDKNSSLDNVSIHFAFSTNRVPGIHGKSLLLVYHAPTNSYIHIALKSDGSLLFEENNKLTKVKVLKPNKTSLADGHRHFVVYNRNGRDTKLIVDFVNYQTSLELTDIISPDSLFSENLVLVGGTNIKEKSFDNFEGCISNIIIELNRYKIEPLESAFGGKEDIDQVKIFGDIKQGICAGFKVIAPVINTLEQLEIETIESLPKKMKNEEWTVAPPILVQFNFSHWSMKKESGFNKKTMLIICLSFLGFVLLSVGLYMWRLQKSYKLKKFQGDTPFFHSKRNSARELKFNMVNSHDDEAGVKLLQNQQANSTNGLNESEPLKEFKNVSDDHILSGPVAKESETSSVVNQVNQTHSVEIDTATHLVPNGSSKLNFEMSRHSYAPELDWDPADEQSDTIKVLMNVDADFDKTFKRRSQAPLASTSEVTINLLSAKSTESFN